MKNHTFREKRANLFETNSKLDFEFLHCYEPFERQTTQCLVIARAEKKSEKMMQKRKFFTKTPSDTISCGRIYNSISEVVTKNKKHSEPHSAMPALAGEKRKEPKFTIYKKLVQKITPNCVRLLVAFSGIKA